MFYTISNILKYRNKDYCVDLRNWSHLDPSDYYTEKNQQKTESYLHKFPILNSIDEYLLTHLMSYNLSVALKNLGYEIKIEDCYRQTPYIGNDYYYCVDTDKDGHKKDFKHSLYFEYRYTDYYSREDEISIGDVDYLRIDDFEEYSTQDRLTYCVTLYQMFEWLKKNNIFKCGFIQSPMDKTKSLVYYYENKEKKYLRTLDNDIEIDMNNMDNVVYIINIFIDKIKKLGNVSSEK